MPPAQISLKSGGHTRVGVCPGQGQRKQRPGGLRPHGGEVAQVHGERLVPDGAGWRVRKEVPTLDQRVGRGDEHATGRHFEQRRVVAHAEQHVAARGGAREETLDQFKFAERHGRLAQPRARPAAACSAARCERDARSSTALTNL